MGVEPMAGSNPEFGMAEPTEWITHDHADTKHLNRAFTRVHWPQDKRVLDYCDRHGILIETEVPAWGPDNFNGVSAQPDADILENGLEQLREMIARDFNHPSVVVWGCAMKLEDRIRPRISLPGTCWPKPSASIPAVYVPALRIPWTPSRSAM
jgi:beta-galactosidase